MSKIRLFYLTYRETPTEYAEAFFDVCLYAYAQPQLFGASIGLTIDFSGV